MDHRGGRLMRELVSVGAMRTEGKSENAQAKCDVVGVSHKGIKRGLGTYSLDQLRCNRGDQ